MQNKGIVKFIAIVLILVCCFYLSFTFVTRHYESKAAAMGEEAGQEYLDSIMNEKVYCGIYSFKQCRELEMGLGLDLKGGMNVILEVSVPDVVDVLADHKQDAAYRKSMEQAKKEEETSQNVTQKSWENIRFLQQMDILPSLFQIWLREPNAFRH